MKKKDLMKGLFAALLVASFAAGANPKSQADFEPKVIYQDSDYIAKHQSTAQSAPVAAPAISSGQADAAVSKAEKPAAQAAGEPASQNYLVGIVALALAGFVFWSKRSEAPAAPKAVKAAAEPVVVSAGAAGETGVARYMKSMGVSGIGSAAVTGVAKYLKNLEATAKTAVATTGVAKYLKNLDSSAR